MLYANDASFCSEFCAFSSGSYQWGLISGDIDLLECRVKPMQNLQRKLFSGRSSNPCVLAEVMRRNQANYAPVFYFLLYSGNKEKAQIRVYSCVTFREWLL